MKSSYVLFKVSPNPKMGVLIRVRKGDDGAERPREDSHVKTEAEIGGTQPQATGWDTKDCEEPPEARRGVKGFLPEAFRGSMAPPAP